MSNIGMALQETPAFEMGEDETGGPAFFWINPWSGQREKIANLWWPAHPPEATEAVEQLFSELRLYRNIERLRSEITRLRNENSELAKRALVSLPPAEPDVGGRSDG